MTVLALPASIRLRISGVLSGLAILVAAGAWLQAWRMRGGQGWSESAQGGILPGTAFLLMVLGTAVLLGVQERSAGRAWAVRVAELAGAASGIMFLGFVLRAVWPGAVLGGWIPGRGLTTGHPALVLFALSLALVGLWQRREPSLVRRQASALLAHGATAVGLVVIIAWVIGGPMVFGGPLAAMALPAAFAAGLLGLALSLAAGLDCWPLSMFGLEAAGSEEARSPLRRLTPLLQFLVAGILVVGLGRLFLRERLEGTQSVARQALTSEADAKAALLARWAAGRLEMATSLSRQAIIQDHLAAFLRDPRTGPAREEMAEFLRELHMGQFDLVMLCRADGRPVITVPDAGADLHGGVDFTGLEEALRSQHPVWMDLHRDPGRLTPHIGLWVPVRGRSTQPRALGALLLVMDPVRSLFAQLQRWPAQLASAQALLVRPEGADLAVLNEEPGQPETALSRWIPLARASEALKRAARREEGMVDGPDELGVPILSVVRRVPATSWMLVVRASQFDLFAALRRQAWTTGAGLYLALVLIGQAIGLGVRRRDALAAQAQAASHRRYEAILQQANDAILLVMPDGHIAEANRQAESLYGYGPGELVGVSVLDIRCAEERAEAEVQLARARTSAINRWEARHQRRDGSTFPVEVSVRAVLMDEGTCYVSFIRDNTLRVAQEQELRRLNRLYEALGRVNEVIVRSRNSQGLFAQVCRAMVESGGFSTAWVGWEVPGASEVRLLAKWGDEGGLLDGLVIRTDDPLEGEGAVGTAIRQGCPCIFNDYLAAPESLPWRHRLASAGFHSVAAFPVKEGGATRGVLVVYSTERDFFGAKEASLLEEVAMDLSYALDHLNGEALRLQRERELRMVSTAVQQNPLSVEITDPDGVIQYVNPAYCAHTGYSPEEAIGQTTGILGPGQPDPIAHQEMRATLMAGKVWAGASISRRKDGSEFHEWAVIAPVFGEEGQITHFVAMKEDITATRQAEAERRQLEAQLHQSQKLESLGSLAGGIAHDMNNVLGAIMGLASAMKEGQGLGSMAIRHLDTIESACLRGRGVVKGLLTFARKDLEQEQPVDLNGMLRELVGLLGQTTLKRVDLGLDLEEGLPQIWGDSGALSHAVMNLCVNAMDAMPKGGAIRVQTHRDEAGGVEIRVVDSGEGMPPEVLAKAMEPFYSTKGKGKGTGLGLSMVYGTMKAHEGALVLRSEVGLGTEAILQFPASRVIGGAPAEAASPLPLAPAHETAPSLDILLVDDDDLIRESVAPMMELLGHRVVAASSGHQALRLVEEGAPLDLVVLDMNMPGMTGAEVLPRLRALRPDVPVIIASGFSDEDVTPLARDHAKVGSLQKPFSLKEIQAQISALTEPVGDGARQPGS